MEAEKIELKCEETNVLTRWPCTICGGYTEKHGVLVEGKAPDGSGTIRCCEFCLRVGEIDARLRKHAERLEAEAAFVRSLMGRLNIPSYDQWVDANEQSEIRDIEDRCGCTNAEAKIEAAQYVASLRAWDPRKPVMLSYPHPDPHPEDLPF